MSEEASESTASENDASSEGADTLEGTLATTEAEDAPNTTDAEGTLESLVDAPTDEQDPFNYPYASPGHSFVSDGDEVLNIQFGKEGDLSSAYIMKDGKQVSIQNLIEGKQALVVYGSLGNPQQIAKSLGKKEVAAVQARVKGLEPGYNLISKNGNAIAEVLPSEGATMEAYVLFVDQSDISKLNSRESHYDLVSIDDVTLETGESIDSKIYMGNTPLWNIDGQPVGMQEIATSGRKYAAKTHQEALTAMIRQYGLADQGISTPRQFIDAVKTDKSITSKIEAEKNKTGLASAVEQYKAMPNPDYMPKPQASVASPTI
jgi:gamma-glutamylcyclotransferase (GGCT)/AIG2-like uncharacterized protein YtfP